MAGVLAQDGGRPRSARIHPRDLQVQQGEPDPHREQEQPQARRHLRVHRRVRVGQQQVGQQLLILVLCGSIFAKLLIMVAASFRA